jgi:hypothetical protein
LQVYASNTANAYTSPTNAKPDKSSDTPYVWTITTEGTVTDSTSDPIILDANKLAFNGTAIGSAAQGFVANSTTKAAGSIKAANGTAIVLTAPTEQAKTTTKAA